MSSHTFFVKAKRAPAVIVHIKHPLFIFSTLIIVYFLPDPLDVLYMFWTAWYWFKSSNIQVQRWYFNKLPVSPLTLISFHWFESFSFHGCKGAVMHTPSYSGTIFVCVWKRSAFNWHTYVWIKFFLSSDIELFIYEYFSGFIIKYSICYMKEWFTPDQNGLAIIGI